MQYKRKFVMVALLVEGGLALVALALGWLLNQPPLESVGIARHQLQPLGWSMLMGLLATLPLLAGMLLANRFSRGPFGNLNRVIEEMIVPMFRNATILDFAAVSLAAGLGEEMLFRGLLQSWLASHTSEDYGPVIGLTVASILFGLCHCVTPLYAMLAGMVGAYLGCLFILTGNLAAPAVCHAAYDFVALLYFCRWRQRD